MPLHKIDKISSTRTVAIWHITESEEPLSSHINSPCPNEIKAPNKRLEWLASRALLYCISSELNFKFNGLSKDENGKPILIGLPYEISITHSFPYVAVIMDSKNEVGIDLEQPKEKIQRIAHKFCSKQELIFANEDPIMLCILWSAKEALYKIHSKKGLIFNEHLIVESFKRSGSGTIDAIIAINDYQKKVILQYIVTSDYVLVYNLN